MTVRIWLWVDLHRSRNWPWLHNVSTSDSLAKGEDYPGSYRLSQNTTGGDLAYGVGLKYSFSKDYALVVDYTNYYNKGDIKIQGLGVGVSFNY